MEFRIAWNFDILDQPLSLVRGPVSCIQRDLERVGSFDVDNLNRLPVIDFRQKSLNLR